MQELTVEKSSARQIACPIPVGEDIPPLPAMLQRAFESFWQDAYRKAKGIAADGFADMEKEFRDRLLKIGAQVMEEAMVQALGMGYRGSQMACSGCGGRAKFMNHRPRTITTLVRDIRLKRSYYHCKKCGKGQTPMDGMLSLNGTSFSPGVGEAICLLDAEMPFDRGSALLERLSAIRLVKEEGRQLAEELGRKLDEQTLGIHAKI